MRLGYKFILILFLLAFAINANIAAVDTGITGKIITGMAPGPQSTNLSISVLAVPPSLTIHNPKNGTYLTNLSLLLDYSVSMEQAAWYNLDNTDNITDITSPLYFNTTEGSHTLYLYANNSENLTAKNVTFFVNLTQFTIIDTEYKDEGETTDFLSYTYEELQNLSDVTLEKTDSGKILFLEAINLTDDANASDNILDMDNHTNISSNRIEINSAALPNLNKPATLWLYNLNFSNPRILRDGEICSSSICTIEDYSEGTGTLRFTVTQFSVYSAEETPVIVTLPSGRGGIKRIKGFTIDKERISISLKQGETKKELITITNTGNQKLSIALQSPELQEFIKISEMSFDLEAGEVKIITLDFLAREDITPDLYMGKLIVQGDGIEKEILIAIEIESEKPLLDVKAEILKKFLYIMPGEELMVKISLFKFGEVGRVDVSLDYVIKDEDGNAIVKKQETRAVETETSFIKTFEIPKDAKYGTYIFYVKTTYVGEVASASAWFSIGEKPFLKTESIILILIVTFIIIILLAVLYELKKLRRYMKTHMKIKKSTLVKEGLIKFKK